MSLLILLLFILLFFALFSAICIGWGFLVHWILPALTLGEAIITGTLMIGFAIFFAIILYVSLPREEEMEGEGGEQIIVLPSPPIRRKRKGRPKRR